MIFRIDLKIFLFLILLYFTKQIQIYSIIMIFAIVHEFGHLIAGIILNMRLKKITLMPLGFSAELKINMKDYNYKILKSNKLELKKLIIAFFGPMINILIIVLVNILNIKCEIKQLVIYSNILIVIFNLIPIYPLDGGRIVKSFLSLIIGREKANFVTNKLSNIFLFIITCIFSILIYYLKNISLLLILLYLWYIVFKENNIYKMKSKLYNALKKM